MSAINMIPPSEAPAWETRKPLSRNDFAKATLFQRNPSVAWLVLVTPVILYLLLFFAYPLGEMVLRSFFSPGFTLANYGRIFASDTYLILIWNTVRISLLVALAALACGYPIAVWMARLGGRMRGLAIALVALPLWTSALVRNYAWIILLQRDGPIAAIMGALGMRVPNLLYSQATVIFGMVYTLLPYMIFTLYNAMRSIDPRYVAAARGLGAHPFRAFVRIYVPLSMPAVSAGFLIVFVISVGFFITPAMLGGGHVDMIAPQIDTQMNTLVNWGFGAALSTVLFIIVVLVMAASVAAFDIEAFGFEKRPRSLPIGTDAGRSGPTQSSFDTTAAGRLLQPLPGPTKPGSIESYDRMPRPLGRLTLSVFSVAVLLVLLAPMIVIVGSSFTPTPYPMFPPPGLSLRWYQTVLGDSSWIAAAILSVKSASMTTLAAVALGTLASLCLVRGRFVGRQAVYVLVIAPLIVPTIILAVGVYFLFIKLHLLGSVWSFVLAYTVQTLPLVVLVVSSALRRVDVSLERAAVILGASPVRAFFTVTLPAILPAVLAAGLFAFIYAFDDVVIAEFIAGTTTATLPKKMWVSLLYSIDPTVSVVSTVSIVVAVLLLSVIGLVQMGSGQRAGK